MALSRYLADLVSGRSKPFIYDQNTSKSEKVKNLECPAMMILLHIMTRKDSELKDEPKGAPEKSYVRFDEESVSAS